MGSTTSTAEQTIIKVDAQQRLFGQVGTPEQDVYLCFMEKKHIQSVCELEQQCFPSPWTETMFCNEIETNSLARYFVLLNKQDPTQVIAYAGYWKVLDEGQITNVAVRPSWQGHGFGTYLFQQMMAFAKAEGVMAMTLEVRRSNEVAQKLYRAMGFTVEGVRSGYYENNGEDALLMWYRSEEDERHE